MSLLIAGRLELDDILVPLQTKSFCDSITETVVAQPQGEEGSWWPQEFGGLWQHKR